MYNCSLVLGSFLSKARSCLSMILFCCAAIAWKSLIQPVIATSSTEAELYAGVTCAKAAKYLRYVLAKFDA